jgi:hypothetical protein
MSYFPTTASESSTDQDIMKHPWRAMTDPRSTAWMGGPGKEATSADAWHMTANRIIPLHAMTKSRLWAVYRCPKAQGALQITFDNAMNSRYSIGSIARKEGQQQCPCGYFVN